MFRAMASTAFCREQTTPSIIRQAAAGREYFLRQISLHCFKGVSMTRKTFALVCSLPVGCLITAGLVAQQTATEAPTGFTTPAVTQMPGSQSTSTGIPEPPGDSFALDQAQFERVHDASTGLGQGQAQSSMQRHARSAIRMA